MTRNIDQVAFLKYARYGRVVCISYMTESRGEKKKMDTTCNTNIYSSSKSDTLQRENQKSRSQILIVVIKTFKISNTAK